MSNYIFDADGNRILSAYNRNGATMMLVYDKDGDGIPLTEIPEPTENTWYISQVGYDSDKAKIATLVDAEDGDTFELVDVFSGNSVFTGNILSKRADFSSVTTNGRYYLKSGNKYSYDFVIDNDRIRKVELTPALKFMEMSRQDTTGTSGTGYAWRDSHQFSFELNGLVMQYMSDPKGYESLPWNVYNAYLCIFEELRTQDCPNIVWLMKYAVKKYYDWNINYDINLHAMIKGQLAYFLYLYPHISKYIDAEWYETIRDWTISIWSETTCDKSWFDVVEDNNLYSTQSVIGTTKGNCPPGYAIVPNLMMYEVCARDGLPAEDFMEAAENNLSWLVNSVDLTDPVNTKGQRMSEYIPFHALTYAYELYPEHCPVGTYNVILEAAQTLINLSDNMWDYTKYSNELWVQPGTGGLANNPGYVGMMGVYFGLARVITDQAVKSRLKELAITHHDHGFGRNPLGRCYDFKATEDFEDAKLGWVTRPTGGVGLLYNCIGVLDGSPKEANFPYNPSGDTGYTEGWIAFNSAWNMGLAYLAGEKNMGIGIFGNS